MRGKYVMPTLIKGLLDYKKLKDLRDEDNDRWYLNTEIDSLILKFLTEFSQNMLRKFRSEIKNALEVDVGLYRKGYKSHMHP